MPLTHGRNYVTRRMQMENYKGDKHEGFLRLMDWLLAPKEEVETTTVSTGNGSCQIIQFKDKTNEK
jgi:hypothetical protein